MSTQTWDDLKRKGDEAFRNKDYTDAMKHYSGAIVAAAAYVSECGNADCRAVLSPPMQQCSRCKRVAYCSQLCQKTAWRAGHKNECCAASEGFASANQRAVLYSNRAAVHIQEGCYALALEDAAKAIQLDETCARAYQRRARALLELGEWKEALLAVRQGGKHCSESSEEGDKADVHARVRQALAEIEMLARDAVNAQDVNSMPRPGKVVKESAKMCSSAVMYHCGNCGQASPKLFKLCQRCLKVGYCSIECQKQNWGLHKPFCNTQVEARVKGGQHSDEALMAKLIEWEQAHMAHTHEIITFAYMLQHALLPGMFGDSPCFIRVIAQQTSRDAVVADVISLSLLRAQQQRLDHDPSYLSRVPAAQVANLRQGLHSMIMSLEMVDIHVGFMLDVCWDEDDPSNSMGRRMRYSGEGGLLMEQIRTRAQAMALDPRVRQCRYFVAHGDVLPTVDIENLVRFTLPLSR